MQFDIPAMPQLDRYKLLTGLIVPRPIAFVSSMSKEGTRNAAPFSFFNMFGADPPIVVLGINTKSGGPKDSFRNICETEEFVVNIVNFALAEKMNACSADLAPDIDEFEIAGLTSLPSTRVAPPRIAEAPASIECRLRQTVPVGEGRALIIGEAVYAHVDDALLDGVKVDQLKIDIIGRMGGPLYTRTNDVFPMARP